MIDNPMTRNTDNYPYNSRSEYLQAKLREIEDIDAEINSLSDESLNIDVKISNLVVRKNEIEREIQILR
jgi:Arc/MetJ-type ribon-helix-helix transcriptional regulator